MAEVEASGGAGRGRLCWVGEGKGQGRQIAGVVGWEYLVLPSAP